MRNWKWRGRRRSGASYRYYLSICPEGLRKTAANLTNPWPSEHEEGHRAEGAGEGLPVVWQRPCDSRGCCSSGVVCRGIFLSHLINIENANLAVTRLICLWVVSRLVHRLFWYAFGAFGTKRRKTESFGFTMSVRPFVCTKKNQILLSGFSWYSSFMKTFHSTYWNFGRTRVEKADSYMKTYVIYSAHFA
jgi:hypothetical protein